LSVNRERIVGLEILYPFRCNTGKTVPSVFGFMNLQPNQEVANGPVSASPSPTTVTAIRFGLSRTAPNAWAREYPNSPPSCIEPGVSGTQWDPIPPGKENGSFPGRRAFDYQFYRKRTGTVWANRRDSRLGQC